MLKNINSKLIVVITLGIINWLTLAGCATSAPKAKFTQPLPPSAKICNNDETKVKVDAASGVSLIDWEKQRLAQRIQEKITSKKSRDYASQGAAESKKEYEVCVEITRYDKGNAFARAMLAGLGQIHINGNVKLYVLPNREQVSEFTIKKTFAWGGLYGGVTSMEDVESGFADGIADALTVPEK